KSGLESTASREDGPSIFRVSNRPGPFRKEKKLGHRRVTQEGTVTYKKLTRLVFAYYCDNFLGHFPQPLPWELRQRVLDSSPKRVFCPQHATSEIQKAIQLGIHHSIGIANRDPMRDIIRSDFEQVISHRFPKEGTNCTPGHQLADFTFKTYAPIAFRAFRNVFHIDMLNFLNSVCNCELKELSNPGASGSIFFMTEDDVYIIKTVQHREAEFLHQMLSDYFINLNQNPRTLLPKFYGLHSYRSGGKNIRFVIMNNILPSRLKIHEKYDLKGSTYKRQASEKERNKSSPTLKDLDFRELHPNGILLERPTYEALMDVITRDCRVLQAYNIMDYSLLLGIHNLDQAKRDRTRSRIEAASLRKQQQQRQTVSPKGEELNGVETSRSSPEVETNSALMSRNKSIKHPHKYLTVLETLFENTPEPIDLEADEMDITQYGGIPARSQSGDRLILYLGIIDILQSYRVMKKLEHQFKAIAIDAHSVSVTHPKFYANRFVEHLCKRVFKFTNSLDDGFDMPNKTRFKNIVHM
ncbi:hypothetical protein Ciccas_009658, partial [Cichlidogyrus casuarinus]